ncbi:Eaf6p [Sporobolomyces koalae]|uniref:Eaf6p n=1 Tax=Sporobolomyces koalae TaxID=500713 RepID=UPI0031804F65
MSASPARRDQSGQSTPGPNDTATTSQSQTPAPSTRDAPADAPASEPAPSPLDALSPAELKQRLETHRIDLRAQLEKKRKLDRDLAVLESSIYAFEGSYLSDSLFPPSATSNAASTAAAQFGNIIRGYDSYLKAPSSSSSDRNKRTRGPEGLNERERMFSASSATYTKSVELRQAELAAAGLVMGTGHGGTATNSSFAALDSASEEDSITSSNRRKRNRH